MVERYSKQRFISGIPAICFYLIHAVYLFIRGEDPGNLLWACHLGAIAVGFGLILRLPALISTGVLWLGLGNIMWMLYLFGKGEFIVTSVLTHLGGIIIGIIGVYKTGMVKLSWLRALVGLAALQHLCRWITPAEENVNLAFRVHEGWEKLFPSYGWYLVVLLLLAGTLFFLMEHAFRLLSSRSRIRNGRSHPK
ncbi:MAG: hypothetical protein KAT34_02850 [Candidatus Aminicenantes bacterium]|nr:hypothetical protein [Candidatus Aminicenantes bacterium]